jgi:hypothetical protein
MTSQSLNSLSSPPVKLFQGCNSVLGKGAFSTAVEGEFQRNGAYNSVSCSVNITMEELAKSLSINQSLSVGFAGSGVNEKVSLFHSLKFTTYSTSISVYAMHRKGADVCTNVRFKQNISIPKNDEEANEFCRYYGDSFVSEVSYGGEYIAVYTFYSQTKEEQTTLKSSLESHGIFDGVSVSGDLQTAMDNFLKTVTVEYSFHQTLTGVEKPNLPTPADFINYAIKFPSITLDAPVVINVGYDGYESVRGSGAGFDQVVVNRRYFTGDSFAGGLNQDLYQIQQCENQITQITKLYQFYGFHSDSVLEENATTAKDDITAIQQQMETFGKTPAAPFIPLTLKSLKNGTPVLQLELSESPYWGGDGGGSFNDVDKNQCIQQGIRITAISLRTGDRVDQLCTTYTNALGVKQIKAHGGTGGHDGETIDLSSDQFVTHISGLSGSRVYQLHLTVTQGKTIAGGGNGGGLSGPKDTSFSWNPPPGFFVLGFKGRCGTELDGIQVICAKLHPAEWIALG